MKVTAICDIARSLVMEAVRTSETPVYFKTTRRYIPEGCRLHTRRRENLTSDNDKLFNSQDKTQPTGTNE
jgi:hypothetical protein